MMRIGARQVNDQLRRAAQEHCAQCRFKRKQVSGVIAAIRQSYIKIALLFLKWIVMLTV